jgi:hypothetical protein
MTKEQCNTIVLPNRRVSQPLMHYLWIYLIFHLGFGGGIVQMPEGCVSTEQIMGSGMTVYYMVDSLETVSLRSKTIQATAIDLGNGRSNCHR